MVLYIGNISTEVKEDELMELFSVVENPITLKIIKNHGSGVPRGFAFVEFSSQEIGDSVINKFHGHSFHGRVLKVREANKKMQSSRTPGVW